MNATQCNADREAAKAKVLSHTPGPWEIESGLFPSENLYVWSSVVPNTEVTRAIATVHPDSGGDIHANARLIASAPKILAALREFVALNPHGVGAQNARAVIAEVDGAA